jgi:hypothetical protein
MLYALHIPWRYYLGMDSPSEKTEQNINDEHTEYKYGKLQSNISSTEFVNNHKHPCRRISYTQNSFLLYILLCPKPTNVRLKKITKQYYH